MKKKIIEAPLEGLRPLMPAADKFEFPQEFSKVPDTIGNLFYRLLKTDS